MPEEYTDIAVFTHDTYQIVIRVQNPQDQEQVQQAVKAVLLGLRQVCPLDDLMALRRKERTEKKK